MRCRWCLKREAANARKVQGRTVIWIGETGSRSRGCSAPSRLMRPAQAERRCGGPPPEGPRHRHRAADAATTVARPRRSPRHSASATSAPGCCRPTRPPRSRGCKRDGHVRRDGGRRRQRRAGAGAADVGIAMGTGADVAIADRRHHADARPTRCWSPTRSPISRATYAQDPAGPVLGIRLQRGRHPAGGCGLLSPMIAGGAMAFSSVSVVSNALLLRRWRPGGRT